jgi:hypothetical protein
MSQEMTMAKAPTKRSPLPMLKSNIIRDFELLGIETHKPPRSKDNRALIAWEFFTSYTLKACAEARYKKAAKEAIKVGVIFDHEKEPLAAGTKDVCYAGDHITVNVEVRQPYAKVDPEKLCGYLRGKGVSQQYLDEALAYATSMTKAPHVFRAELTVSE